MKKTTTKTENLNDYILEVLMVLGMSTKCIMRETGYTFNQVTYRIYYRGLAGHRKEFRNGTSATARKLLELGLGRRDVLCITRSLRRAA